jgi:hypothetical protein
MRYLNGLRIGFLVVWDVLSAPLVWLVNRLLQVAESKRKATITFG